MPGVGPGAHEMMVTIGVFCQKDFASSLARAEVFTWEDVKIFIDLIFAVWNETILSHYSANGDCVRCQI